MRLLCRESCMIPPSTVFDWPTRVTVRRTDRRTDGRAIARYSICRRTLKNLPYFGFGNLATLYNSPALHLLKTTFRAFSIIFMQRSSNKYCVYSTVKHHIAVSHSILERAVQPNCGVQTEKCGSPEIKKNVESKISQNRSIVNTDWWINHLIILYFQNDSQLRDSRLTIWAIYR